MGSSLSAAESDPASPLYGLAQEAVPSGESYNEEDLELKAQRALECPCVAELRDGPCGKAFSDALVCFIKSTAEEKGSDCVYSFLTMQACMLENPDAFARHGKENVEEEHKGDNTVPATKEKVSKL